MANNQEFFCNHCKRETTFYQESDLLWYCDECGNVLGSFPAEEYDDWGYDFDESGLIHCPYCNNDVQIEELIDGVLCPVCCEDLSEEVEDYSEDDFWDNGEEDDAT